MSDPFSPIATATAAAPKRDDGWRCLMPVPDDAPAPPDAHPNLGKPSGRWFYADAAAALLGLANRFDAADGSKQFRPATLWERQRDHRREWRWETWPTPRPLYGLDRLAERPKAPVVVTEGEKAADAAARLLPSHVVVTSPNGSKSAGKADWSPLAGRRVVVWPDRDAPGAAYAEEVARLAAVAGALSVAVLAPPEGVADGWDAADAEVEGWTTARAEALIGSARSAATRSASVVSLADARAEKDKKRSKKPKSGDEGEEAGSGERQRRPRASQALVSLADDVEFWTDPDGTAYATLFDSAAWRNYRVDSKSFARFITTRAILRDGLAPTKNVLEELLRHFDGLAVISGEVRSPSLRVAELGGRYYIDLANDHWQVVEIDAGGWRTLDKSPVPFMRKHNMRALPTPEGGFELDILRNFVRFHDDDDYVLFCMWLLAALLPTGPYPILCFGGEQGVGKSVITELARSLIDPHRVNLRMPPKDDEGLFVSAANNHVLAFDNLSGMPGWLSDALCVIATDGGYGARQKYSDEDEHVMKACRPIIANGIATLTSRPDFGSRAITIRLDRIPDAERRPLRRFWREWYDVRPRIFATLLDGISEGLSKIGTMPEESSGRLADFEMFARAAETGLGFPAGTFDAAYGRNRADLAAATYEADPLAIAVSRLSSEYPNGWVGTPTELLTALNTRVPEETRRQRGWPATVNSLGQQMDRITPVLRSQNILVERRHSGVRMILISPLREGTS